MVSVIAAARGASGLLQLPWLAASVVVVLAAVEVHPAFSERLGRTTIGWHASRSSGHTIGWLLAQ